ncbi:MAG: TlpA disulfide reductase family protein [Candidatus Bathyarchaeota archaeon]|jgi:thiol-disulfide isomerase/thioredoxin
MDEDRGVSLAPFIAVVLLSSVIFGSWFLLKQKGGEINFELVDLDGETVRLSDFYGEVVVLDFMATWCGPCRYSMVGLVSLYEEFGDQFVLISIAVDPISDTVPVLKQWKETYGATWIHTRDLADPPAGQRFDVTGVPTYVIIDKKGKVRFKHIGLMSELKLRQEILSLVQE